MKKAILLSCLFVFSYMSYVCPSHAVIGRTVVVNGTLKSFDHKMALLEDDKGQMKIPVTSVDRKRVRVGQWVSAYVDIVDLVRLNPKKFKTKPAK